MRALIFPLACLLLWTLTGCAGYHLGAVNGEVAGDQTIEVLPFNNQTLQPRLGDAVTQALRERFQVDATYRLVTSSPGDVVVSGVIRKTAFPDHAATKKSLEQILSLNFERIVVGHGNVITHDPKTQLARAYEWLG